MSKYEYSGLLGTQDYLIPITLSSSKPTVVTPTFVKTNMNSTVTTYNDVAGLIPIVMTLNNGTTTAKYEQATIGTTIAGTDGEVSVASADIGFFETGVYYRDINTAELFFVIAKDVTNGKVTFKRGLLGTAITAITASDVVMKLNTIVFDTTTEGHAGAKEKITGTITATKVPTANDTLSLALGDSTRIYTFKATATAENDVAIGADTAAFLGNLAAKINSHFPKFTATVSSNTIVIEAKEKGAVTYIWNASITTSGATFTAAETTQGSDPVYVSGNGFLIYKEMPRNLAYGQSVYPAYNYNVGK